MTLVCLRECSLLTACEWLLQYSEYISKLFCCNAMNIFIYHKWQTAINLDTLESCLRFLHSWFCHNGFWDHLIWPRPFAGSNAVVRFELRPTCLDRQRVQFLLVTSTSAISAFTWHRICGHTRTFVRRVAHWLLQRGLGGRAESDDQQTATSVECRSPSGKRYP